MGLSVFLGLGEAAGKSCGSGVIFLYDVKGVSLVVLKYTYEGVLVEGRGSNKVLVSSISYRVDEIVNYLVDLLRREVGRWRAGKGVKLVVSERTLLSVTPPSEELVGVGNGGT